MLPVVLGLALAIPLALLTGRRWSSGLLRTPEDLEPPPVVARAAALHREWQPAGAPDVARLLREPRLLAAHMAMLPPPRRPRLDPIDATLVLARANWRRRMRWMPPSRRCPHPNSPPRSAIRRRAAIVCRRWRMWNRCRSLRGDADGFRWARHHPGGAALPVVVHAIGGAGRYHRVDPMSVVADEPHVVAEEHISVANSSSAAVRQIATSTFGVADGPSRIVNQLDRPRKRSSEISPPLLTRYSPRAGT